MEYITNPKQENCAFCCEAAKQDGFENLILYRAQRTFIILNRYPYTSGHLMVVPFGHFPSLELLDPETRAEMMEMCALTLRVLRDEYHPQGFNVGVNIGEAGGAGIEEHVHLHIVPRWGGDTNFMSSLAHTRVLPESLEKSYERLKKAWEILKRI
jgi:ATP adenylyltransferase